MGTFTGEEFTAIGNRIVDCNIKNGNYGTAGILGAYYPNHYAKTNGQLDYSSNNIGIVKICIEDCKVEGGQIETNNYNVAGILANYTDAYNNSNASVEITVNNCQVGGINEDNKESQSIESGEEEPNSKKKGITIKGDNSQYGAVGIVGCICFNNSSSNNINRSRVVNITNNVVDNAKIEQTKANTSHSNTVGILGFITYCKELNIVNCKVLDSEISAKNENISGIVGCIHYGCEKSLIEGCEVNNVTIKAENEAGTAGIISHNTGTLDIKDCNVTDLNIEYEKNERETNVASGGIIGYNSSKAHIDNCKVEGINIKGSCNNVGGFVGHDTNGTLKITNSKLTGHKEKGKETKKSKITGTEVVGGIVGYAGYSASSQETTIIDNVECEDLEIEMDTCKDKARGSNTNVGGVIGVGVNKMDITNLKVSNLDVDVKRSCGESYPTPGAYGAIGGNMNTDLIMQNVKVENVNMESNEGNVAIAIANIEGANAYGQTAKLDVSNLEISNCTLETDIQMSNIR